jgi:hypothetical protein
MRGDDAAAHAGRWRRVLPAAIIVVAPLLLFWDATLGRVLLAPGDAISVLVPNRLLVASFLRAGEWPLWNPFVFSGFPMLAVSQMSVMHPGAALVLVRNRRALPRAWLVPAVRALSGGAILAAVRDGRLPDGAAFDPRALALIESAVPPDGLGPADPGARAVVRDWRPNAVAVDTASAAPAFLVLSEVDYPGWQARLDGQPVPILRTNGVLRGVVVPAGAHRVDFSFRPWRALAGAALSLATVLAFAAAALWRWRRRRASGVVNAGAASYG